MKKIISLIMAMVLSASVGLFSACESTDNSLNNQSSSSQSLEDSSSENKCMSHAFSEWETVTEASCVAGQKQRVCGSCNEVETEEIPPLDDFFAHTFDENTLCTTCGHQEFIESEEYIEESAYYGPFYTWMSTDGSYGLQIMLSYDGMFIFGYVGTPINVIIPTSIYGNAITAIGGGYGFGSRAMPFTNCETLESIIIPRNVDIFVCVPAHPFRGCSNLKYLYFPKNTNIATPNFQLIAPNAEIIYYD